MLISLYWVIKAFSSKTAGTYQQVAHSRPRQYYENHQAHEAAASTENQTTSFTRLDFQPDFNMAIFAVCAVLSILKYCFFWATVLICAHKSN